MAAIVFFLLFCITQFVAAALAVLITNANSIAAGGQITTLSPTPMATGTSLFVCESLLCIALWLYFRRKKKPATTESASFGKTALCMVAILLLSFGLSALLDPLHLPDSGTTAMFEGMKHSPLCLLSLCLIGPLCEEMVFRRGIVESLTTRRLSGTMAVTIGAFAFAIIHGNLAQAIPAFVIGIALGLMYLRTRNLQLCFPAHVANNTMGVLVLFFPQMDETTNAWPLFVSLPLSVVMLAAGTLLLWRVLK